MDSEQQLNTWQPDIYDRNARFVSDLGSPVLAMLQPSPGERILDLGCGDGVLTEKIAASGAIVVGVDASEAMVAAARQRGIDARLANGHSMRFEREFDAVFSNAALHWMREPDAVLAAVSRALKPGGRFVAELGGHGCVAAIIVALEAVLARRGINGAAHIPWYFPTAADYRARLERAGFTVDYIELIPRPTPLPTGLEGWLDTFAENLLKPLQPADRKRAVAEAVELLRPVLCDERERWTADYIRLRFSARLAS